MSTQLTNKDRLVSTVAKTVKITQAKAENSINAILNCIKQGVCEDGYLTIRKFGYFRIKNKNKRTGHNFKTGEPTIITARKVITFRPYKTLKYQVNQ